jgi:hypothetical protein
MQTKTLTGLKRCRPVVPARSWRDGTVCCLFAGGMAIAILALAGCGDSQKDQEKEDANAIAVLAEVMDQARAICKVKLTDGLITTDFQAGPNCDHDVTVLDLNLNAVQALRLHTDVDISTLRIERRQGDTSTDGLKFTLTAPSGRRCLGSAAVPIECRATS